MKIFNKKREKFTDFLENKVDNANIKNELYNEINEIKFLELAFYIVTTYISSAIANCEFKVYEHGEEVKNIIYYKLNISPNPNDTGTKLKYNLTKKLIQDGESLVINYQNNLYFANLFTRIENPINGHEFENVSVLTESINKRFNRKTSFYFEFDNEKAKDILKEIDVKYNDLLIAATNLYKKSLNSKWKVKIETSKQYEAQFENEFNDYVTKQLKNFLSGDSGVYPELNGYSLEKLEDGDHKTDSNDIRELRKDIFDMVAQAYKMPVSMMYGNMSNLKEVVNQFIAFAVKPYSKLIGEEMTRTLYKQEDILNGSRIEVDISSINYRDIFDIAAGVDKLISSGVSNIDETRKMINLPTINSDFSTQYWMTKNYAKIDDVMDSSQTDSKEESESILKGGDDSEK